MHINTKRGKPTVLKLSAYERRTLENAKELVGTVLSHSDGELGNLAEELLEVFNGFFAELDSNPPAEGPSLPFPETADVPAEAKK